MENELTDEGENSVEEKLDKKAHTKMPTLIALRPDEDTLKKINILSKIYNTRTETIKRAIDMSYNGLFMKGTLEKIIPLLKNIFGAETKIKTAGIGTIPIFEGETTLDFSFDKAFIIFSLPIYKIKMKDEIMDKNIDCLLDMLAIEIKVEGSERLKIDLTKSLIMGSISNIPSDILKNLHELAAKYELDLKSTTVSKKSEMIFEFNLERYITQEGSWMPKLKKALNRIKGAMDEIEKNPYFCQIKKKN